MATIGLKHIVAGKYAETAGKISHSAGRVLGRAVQANITINSYDVKLYADDGVAEAERGFQDGTLEIQLDDLDQAGALYLLGGTEQAATGVTGSSVKELLSKSTDEAPEVGVGFYAPKVKGGKRMYRAIFIPRVKFGYPNESIATKSEQIAFATPSISGTIMVAADGSWKREITVDSETDAIKWVETAAGVSAT